MPKSRDGGHSALLGFLYQVVVTLGMQAQTFCSDAAVDSDELEAWITMVRDGELYHEHLDSDLLVRGETECGLAQLKYSRQIPIPPIGSKKLIEIVNGLQRSARRAEKHGWKASKFALITNRPLGPEARVLHEAALKKESHEYLTRDYHYGILQDLQFLLGSPLSEWEDALIRFAHSLGALEREVSDGIDKLIGFVVRETVEQGTAKVVKGVLTEAFAGHHQARPLVPVAVAAYSLSNLEESLLNPQVSVIRRELLSAITQATLRSPVVILSGSGGCGKTVALWQWAKDLVVSSPPGNGVFTAVSPAEDLDPNWIAQSVSSWANLPVNSPRCEEHFDRALGRLLVANPGSPQPILHLGLDGLDEEIGVAQRETVKQTVKWFRKQSRMLRTEARAPEAILVVTCRDAGDLAQKWLRDPSGFGNDGLSPQVVEIGDFNEKELERAAASCGIPELHDMIEASLHIPAADRFDTVADGDTFITLGHATSANQANETILQAVRHPAMWRSLLGLAPPAQLKALEGEPGAVEQLAHAFLQRFFSKLSARGCALGLDNEALHHVLHSVALGCTRDVPGRHAFSDWVDSACKTDLVKRVEARSLYYEAISGGLISRDDALHWRWRHPFVGDYLAEIELV